MPEKLNNQRETFSAVGAVAVTPNDSTDLAVSPCRALWIGGAGNVSVDLGNDTAVVFIGCAAGSILPVQAKRVRATSTTATSILALY